MPEEDKFSIEYDLLPKLLGTKRLFGYKTNCYFRDMGTPEDYGEIQKELGRLHANKE